VSSSSTSVVVITLPSSSGILNGGLVTSPSIPGAPLAPAASAFASTAPDSNGNHPKNAPAHSNSNVGAIAGGIIGALGLLALLALAALFFLRRRKNRSAPSAEFLTVYPPDTPFARTDSVRSAGGFSIDPPASYAEKYNSYPQPIVNYP
jgi:MYXO-CTERM domain-containing protein